MLCARVGAAVFSVLLFIPVFSELSRKTSHSTGVLCVGGRKRGDSVELLLYCSEEAVHAVCSSDFRAMLMPVHVLWLRCVARTEKHTYTNKALALRSSQSYQSFRERHQHLMTLATSSGQQLQQGKNDVLNIVLAFGRLVLSLLGCDSLTRDAGFSNGLKKQPARVKIYGDLGVELLRKQLEFRRARYANQRRRLKQERDLSLVSEGSYREEHDHAIDLEMAACIVLQTYVRMLRSAPQHTRAPVYNRSSWVAPNEREKHERVGNLQERFPEMSPNTLRKHLDVFNGHAGYAASALLRGGRHAKYEVAQLQGEKATGVS